MDATAQLPDLRDLLTKLPHWHEDRFRHAFAEQALGKGHRVLSETNWEDVPRNVAWSLVSACHDFAGHPSQTHGPGLSPLCALLAEARVQLGSASALAGEIAALESALGCPAARAEVDWSFDPYPGMAAFEPFQAPIFFGREPETQDLLAKLQTEQGRRLILVAGRSGSGKSSLVRAGLWARLHAPAAPGLPGSADWVITAMKPAVLGRDDPFVALALALARSEPPIPCLRDEEEEARALAEETDALDTLARRVLDGRPEGAEWLLFIDQFEELFTSVPKALTAAFLERVLAPALERPRVRVIGTVRSDFLDPCIASPVLRDAIKAGAVYPLDTPDARALEDMVTGPLRRRTLAPDKRATIDDDLARRLVADASGRPGGLALLAFALHDLHARCLADFKREGGRPEPRMCLADYLQPDGPTSDADEPGLDAGDPPAGATGLDRVIRDRAEAAAARAKVDTAAVLPRVFSRLLTVAADGAATRRREDIDHWSDDPEALALIGALRNKRARLLVSDARRPADRGDTGDAQGRDLPAGAVVEVAHEALFRAWPALADWIERCREALIRGPQIRREAERWDALGRRDERLPNPHQAKETRELLEEAGLWSDLVDPAVKDAYPPLAHFLVRDHAGELFDLTLAARAEPRLRAQARLALLHTLTRFDRGPDTLAEMVERVRAQDAETDGDLARWLRAGIDIEALFSGPDASRWHWHRVALGDLLDALGDDREGVGLNADGLPDIAWCPVPAGAFAFGEGKAERTTDAFEIARYPVTEAQYAAFTNADDYGDLRWWRWWRQDIQEAPPPNVRQWPQGNRPRVQVAWVEAIAFCLWLTERLRGELGADRVIRLPTELEWEKAARGPDGTEFPWGPDYEPGAANLDEPFDNSGEVYLRQTTAVGLYPPNRSPYGVMDCAGNVWDWCLNAYDDPSYTDVGGDAARAVRGGSWFSNRASARASNRFRSVIQVRNTDFGFRLVRAAPIR